jgi:hypothetical protein
MMTQTLNNVLFATGLILLAVSALVACSETSTSPSSVPPTPPAASLSLRTSDWDTISDPAKFPLSNDERGDLVFDFPANGSMNYLYNVRPPKVISGTVSVSLQVTTTGPVVFNYMTEASNTCVTPASVRPLIWANRNSYDEFDRWWSSSIGYQLAAGLATLTVPLTPDRWSSVFGKSGNADAAAQAGFTNALRNVSSLGLTFGGGCFFGHGVNVQGGRAQFALVSYQIQN